MNEATAALFPDSFVESELGLIPKGWKATQWGNIGTLEYGKSLRGYQEHKGIYRVYGTNGPIGYTDNYLSSNSGIIIGRKGAYRGVHLSLDPFFVIDTAFYFKSVLDTDIFWSFYEILKIDINSMDSGSAIPSTSRDDFYKTSVVLPDMNIQNKFGKIVGHFYKKLKNNDLENQKLEITRDTLLPKLLSGELSTERANEQIGEVLHA
jgi:type I restriction enzyme S subunit